MYFARLLFHSNLPFGFCSELCLVTEFVEQGNLFDLLHDEDGRSNGPTHTIHVHDYNASVPIHLWFFVAGRHST